MFKIVKFLITFLILSVIIISSLFFILLWKYSPELPSHSKILQYKPELSSRLYSSDGVLLKSYHREERIFIPIERIPKTLINAFLSSEDKKALINCSGILSIGIKILSSRWYDFNKTPSEL